MILPINQVLREKHKWWKVKFGEAEGYASKYFFAKRGALKDYEKEPWYFGEMSREEAEHLLKPRANSDGSFLVRYSSNIKADVLSLKRFNLDSELGYGYEHHHIKSDSASVWLKDNPDKYKSLHEMIQTQKRAKRVGPTNSTKLTSVCIIPGPHTDPEFESYNKDYNSLWVPQHQIKTGEVICSESSGFVRTARLSGSIDVVVTQLKFHSQEESAVALATFFDKIGYLRKLDHPNVAQLFGYTLNTEKESFLISGVMFKGDLKTRLQEMWQKGDTCGDATLFWAVEVASGMKRLANLNIVHGDLAARSVNPRIYYFCVIGTYCWINLAAPEWLTTE